MMPFMDSGRAARLFSSLGSTSRAVLLRDAARAPALGASD